MRTMTAQAFNTRNQHNSTTYLKSEMERPNASTAITAYNVAIFLMCIFEDT